MSDFPTLTRLAAGEGRVAVTIDDGPNPDTTLAMLDVLAAYGAKASFFACGINLERFPALAARIVAEGHGLFSHAWDHPAFDTLDAAGIRDQLERTEAALIRFRPAEAAPLVRFPFGAGVDDPAVRQAVATWNPATVAVQWSICAEEWTFIDSCRTPARIQEGVAGAVDRLSATADWDGAVVLLHDWPTIPADGGPPKPLAAAFCAGLLEAYLIEIRRRRLTPVPLTAHTCG